MPMFPPIPLIRQNYILRKLRNCNAISESTAVTLREAGIINPRAFPNIIQKLAEKGLICQSADGRYYIPPENKR